MNSLTSLFRTTIPALGLLALLVAAPASLLVGADHEASPTTKTHFMENCAVCNKSVKGGTDKKTMVEGREMHTCGDKCAADMAARPEYYKGVYDGSDRVHKSHIGPKGGDTIKGPHPDAK